MHLKKNRSLAQQAPLTDPASAEAATDSERGRSELERSRRPLNIEPHPERAESSSVEQSHPGAPTHRERVFGLETAILVLTNSPRFATVDAALRAEVEPLIKEMEEASALPRPQAIAWLDKNAGRYLSLVQDHATWDSYRILLYELFYPEAYRLLFGALNLIPVSEELCNLKRRLDQRMRYWQQRAALRLARPIRQDQRTVVKRVVSSKQVVSSGQGSYLTALARNLDLLRIECGFSLDKLASQTHLEKKLIIGHIKHGKRAWPKTLLIYAETFAAVLKRKITTTDLLSGYELDFA
jgi:hypothetical protein